MQPIGDTTMATTAAALRGLSMRADVRADNLANVNTPGFRAGRVDFESSLAAALKDGEVTPGEARPSVTVDPNVPGPNQNLVSLEGEMVGLMKDQLLRNAMVHAFNYRTTAFRTAIGNR